MSVRLPEIETIGEYIYIYTRKQISSNNQSDSKLTNKNGVNCHIKWIQIPQANTQIAFKTNKKCKIK